MNWKDINKEKPKKESYVIIQNHYNEVFPSYYSIYGKFKDLEDDEVSDVSIHGSIKYWMYLPKAKND